MKKSIGNHFKELLEDRQMEYVFIAGIIMSICHVYMYIDSGHKIEPLIRICYCAIFFPMALIYGRKWLPWQFVITAFAILYFNKWQNPTSFLLIAAVCLRYPKVKKYLLIVYGIAVAVCLGIGHRNWAHAVLHIMYCVAIWFILLDVRRSFQAKCNLTLTLDEKDILNQLESGKLKKEITGYSKNTITNKIHAAMDRNRCSTEGELMCRFKEVDTKLI